MSRRARDHDATRRLDDPSLRRQVAGVSPVFTVSLGSMRTTRDVEELPAERGVEVDHTTVHRWVQRFTPVGCANSDMASELPVRCHGGLV
jgi:hypothetical protein